jgi:hypothetical protein
MGLLAILLASFVNVEKDLKITEIWYRKRKCVEQ